VGSTGWGVLASSPAATAQGKEEKKKKDKESKKGKKSAKASTNAPAEIGTPAIWEDRGDVAALDLYWGIGGPDSAPKPPFTFDKEDMTGTNPKIKVFDANGVKWNIKFDEEVHAEVACSRIVWACGYMVEESYFVPSGKVQGVSGLTRARKFIGPDGSFTNGMFEKRPDNIARRKTPWSWDSNPFVGTKELSGFAILNALLNNWDAKPDNNNVLGMYDDDGKVKEWYLVADWGGSLGKTGSFAGRSKWDVNDFGRQAFLERGSGNSLKLHYSGKMSSSLKTIPLEHARWFAGIIGQLSDEQLRAAFKAAGATEAEINGFAARLRQKINELKAAVGQVARGQ
jgi:hypothetical protein